MRTIFNIFRYFLFITFLFSIIGCNSVDKSLGVIASNKSTADEKEIALEYVITNYSDDYYYEVTRLLGKRSVKDQRIVLDLLYKLNQVYPNAGFEDNEVLNSISDLLNDNDEKVKIAAINYLKMVNNTEFNNKLYECLFDQDKKVVDASLNALIDIGNEQFIDNVLLRTTNNYYRAKYKDLNTLIAKLPRDLTLIKLHFIFDTCTSDYLKSDILKLYGNIGGEKEKELLINYTKSKNDLLYRAAALALGEMKDPDAIEPLIALLNRVKNWNNGDPPVVIEALADIGDHRSDKVVKEVFRDDHQARKAGLKYFEAMDMQNAVPLVSSVMGYWSVDSDFRKDAIDFILKYNDVRGCKGIVKSLKDEKVRTRALNALEKLQWKPTTNIDKTWYLIAKNDNEEIKQQWPMVKGALFNEIYNGNSWTIEAAYNVLTKYGMSDAEKKELYNGIINRGSYDTAHHFLNCHDDMLVEAANKWANKNGYFVHTYKF